MDFSKSLLNWYRIHKRELPWRGTSNAYHIWLSEIIMQQTRVEQGTDYYLAFVKNFPSPTHLAKAPIDKVLKLWQGLGYYSRARNMHQAAQVIVTQYNGVFPDTYEDILKLKGVGEYTAAAIASFAYNKVHAVVDGNVYRLLARVFGIDTPIDSGKGKSEFRELAAELIDSKQPGTYNQAIMEFGGRYCKPRNPDCENCIFAGICVAKEKGLVHSLPVKASKTKVRDRHFQYLFIRYKGKTWLKKRGAKDIWQGLYDFPLIETEERIDEVRLKKNPEWKAYFKNNTPFVVDHSSEFKHLLSHQRIYATFWVIDVASAPVVEGWTMTPASKLHTFAVPRLMDLYLSQ